MRRRLLAALVGLGALVAAALWWEGGSARRFRAEVAAVRAAAALATTDADLPAPTPHLPVVWVGRDEIVLDPSDWLAHPVHAVAPDDPPAPAELLRVPLVDGALPAAALRGASILPLSEGLLDLAGEHQARADAATALAGPEVEGAAPRPDLRFTGELAVAFDAEAPAALVRAVLSTAAQTPFSRVELWFAGPDGTLRAGRVQPLGGGPTWGLRIADGAATLAFFGDDGLEPEPLPPARGVVVPCAPQACAAAVEPHLREIGRYLGRRPELVLDVADGATWGDLGPTFAGLSGETAAVGFGVAPAREVVATDLGSLIEGVRGSDPNFALLREHPGLSGAVLVEDVWLGLGLRASRPGDVRALRGCYLDRRLERPELAGVVEIEAGVVSRDEVADEALVRCTLTFIDPGGGKRRVTFSP